MLHWLRRMDGTTRFFFLGLVWIAGYFVSIFTFSLAFNQHIAKLMMNYYTDQGVYLNVGALLAAFAAAFAVSLGSSDPGKKFYKEIT